MSKEKKPMYSDTAKRFISFATPELRNWLVTHEEKLRKSGENFAYDFFKNFQYFNFLSIQTDITEIWKSLTDGVDKNHELTYEKLPSSVKSFYTKVMDGYLLQFGNFPNVITCDEIQYVFLSGYLKDTDQKRAIICHMSPERSITIKLDEKISSVFFVITEASPKYMINLLNPVNTEKVRGMVQQVETVKIISKGKINHIGLKKDGTTININKNSRPQIIAVPEYITPTLYFTDETEGDVHSSQLYLANWSHKRAISDTISLYLSENKNFSIDVPEGPKDKDVFFFIHGYLSSVSGDKNLMTINNPNKRNIKMIFTSMTRKEAESIMGEISTEELNFFTPEDPHASDRNSILNSLSLYFTSMISPLEKIYTTDEKIKKLKGDISYSSNYPLIHFVNKENLEEVKKAYQFFASRENYYLSEKHRTKKNNFMLNFPSSDGDDGFLQKQGEEELMRKFIGLKLNERKEIRELCERMDMTKKTKAVVAPFMREDVYINESERHCLKYEDKVDHISFPELALCYSGTRGIVIDSKPFIVVDFTRMESDMIISNCDIVILKGEPSSRVNVFICGKIHTLIDKTNYKVELKFDNVSPYDQDLLLSDPLDQFYDYQDSMTIDQINSLGLNLINFEEPSQIRSWDRTMIRNYYSFNTKKLNGTLMVKNFLRM